MHSQSCAEPDTFHARKAVPRPWLRRFLRRCGRFGGDARGAAAIEFALVSIPFLGLIFAIIETMCILLFSGVMENAVETASRRMYTGQFQQENASASAGDPAANFKKEFCARYVGLNTCDQVKVDVRSYDTFPDQIPSPVVRDANGRNVVDPNFGQFTKPKRNQIVVVRAVVENPVFFSLLNPNQTNLSSGKRLIVGTFAFRSEPF